MSAVHQNTSEGCRSNTQSIVSLAHSKKPPVECWTPLGLPVEPEVKRMNRGCSAPTATGAHSVLCPANASVNVTSRPATMLQAVVARWYTNTVLIDSQPPRLKPSSTIDFKGNSLPPRF